MKKTLLLLMLCCTVVSAFGQVLFDGFENDMDGTTAVNGWTSVPSGSGYDWYVSNGGSYAARTGTADIYLYPFNSCWLFHQVSLTAGITYTITCYAKLDIAAAPYATIALAYGTNSTAAAMITSIASATIAVTSYQLVSGTFTPATTGMYYLGILGSTNTAVHLIVDDVSLTVPTTTTSSLQVTPAVLNFDSVASCSISVPKPAIVIGSNLSPASGNITVTAPAGFEVSANDTNWAATATLAYTSGVISTHVFMHFVAAATGFHSGVVNLSGGGLNTPVTMNVTGTGTAPQKPQPITGTTKFCYVGADIKDQLYESTTGGTWACTDTSVATINNTGSLNIKKVGTATILYFRTNCNNITDTVSATISVMPLPAPVVSVNGNVLSTGIFTTYQWSRDGVIISGATSQTYTATQNGNYTVTVTNANGCSDTAIADTVKGLSISTINTTDNNWQIYPNPSAGIFTIQGNVPAASGVVVAEVLNMIGQVVYQENLHPQNGKLSKQVQLVNNTNGVYLLHIKTGTSDHIERIVIAK